MPDRHLDIAIIGGGFAGVFCAQRFLKRARHLGLTVGLIARENHMVFQPMLAEVVGGSLSPRHVVNPIRLLCRGAEVLRGEVTHIDLEHRTLTLDGGRFSSSISVSYDHLVLAPGADVDLSRIPGMTEHAYLMRNCGDAMKLRAVIIERMEEANLLEDESARRRLLSFVVVGGGYSGVETAGQIADLLRGVCRYYENIDQREPSVTLVQSGDRLLPTLDASLAGYTHRQLEKMGVKVILGHRVKSVTAGTVMLDDGAKLDSTVVVCTVGNAPHPMLSALGSTGLIPLERGKVVVEPTGLVKGHDRLWAAGDCAVFPKADGGRCPETAQFAMRQGLLIGENIAARCFDHPLRRFTFTGLGELASIGHRKAVAQIGGVNFSGFIAWFMWRTIYLGKLPGLDRKLRVVAEWTFELFFPRDINLLTPQYSSPLGEMHLEPGDILFRAGEPAFSLYAVKSGRVDIADEAGQVVKSIGAGGHFGERALLEDRIWRFTATAREPSTLVAVSARTFQTLVGSMGQLDRIFRRSAERYCTPEELGRTVSQLPAGTRSRTAGEIMRKDLATLLPTASLTEALELFRNNPHSTYPVVSEAGLLLGLLRRASVYDWLVHHELDASATVDSMPLSTAMRVAAGDSAADVLEDLVRTGATKAVVVDEGQRLLGLITLVDLLGHSSSRTSSS